MKSNTLFSIIVVLGLIHSGCVFAQTNGITHDSPKNDPSDPSKALRLKKPIPQKDLAIKGSIRSLFQVEPISISSLTSLLQGNGPNYSEILNQQPHLFKLLQINASRRTPKRENGPTTVNANHEYAGISDREFGYCWGYATLVRYFSQVAFFDASKPKPSLKTTYKLIDRLLEGEATVFEGYSNLRDLTMVPEIEFYLKLAAMELWRERAVQFSSVGITLNSTKWMDFNEVERFLTDLEARLARGEFPKLIFSSLIPTHPFYGINTDIHVVPAYKVERLSKNRARIHLWDINFYAETLVKSPKYLEIDSDHAITYAPYVEVGTPYSQGSDMIGRVIIAPENDDETATMIKSLKRFCRDSKTSNFCKKAK